MPGHLSHGVVTLTGTSNVLNLGTLLQAAGVQLANTQVAFMELQPFGANSGIVYIGASVTMSTTNYGTRLEIPVSTVPQAPYRLPDTMLPCALEDVYLIGTNTDKVSVLMQLLL